MSQKTTEKPWMQQPNENPMWYDRFFIYLMLGPTRSFNAAYRVAKQKSEGRANSHWGRIAKEWDWRARVDAFDAYGYAELMRKETARRREQRERRLRMIQEMLDASFDGLRTMVLKELDPNEARTLFPQLRLTFRDTIIAQRNELGLDEPEDETGEVRQDEKSARILREVYGEQAAKPDHEQDDDDDSPSDANAQEPEPHG